MFLNSIKSMFNNPILREKTTDFVKTVGQEMYNVVGGSNIPNLAGVALSVGFIRQLIFVKNMGDDFWLLWNFYGKKNVSPFKPVPLLPLPEEGEEPLVLEHWSRLDWTPADIYGGEEANEDGGPVVLPEAKSRSILKRVKEGESVWEGEGEEECDWEALEPPRCSHDRRVAFDIRPEDPREQQPPHPRPQLRRPADTL